MKLVLVAVIYTISIMHFLEGVFCIKKFLKEDFKKISQINDKLIKTSGFENLIDDSDLEVVDNSKGSEDDPHNFGYHEDYTPLDDR